MLKGLAVVATGVLGFFGVLKAVEAYERKYWSDFEKETQRMVLKNARLRRQLVVVCEVKKPSKKRRA